MTTGADSVWAIGTWAMVNCNADARLIWLIDRTRRISAWPDARLALLATMGWVQAQESLALTVIPEDSEPALVHSCLHTAAEHHLSMTVISIATGQERKASAPPALRCADLESITQAVQQATTRARDHSSVSTPDVT
ncbi:MAG: hypothetical protein ACKOW5_06880 [Actinomycetales bacterium]